MRWSKQAVIVCVQLNQDSHDHCPMLINADKYYGIDPKYLTMPIIAEEFSQWLELIGNEPNLKNELALKTFSLGLLVEF